MKNHYSHKPSFLTPAKPRVMAKWFSVLILMLVMSFEALAQKSILVVEGSSPKLYLNHKIAPKENFYSIGRMYNLPAKEIAAYNNLQFENGLSIGQLIKIPLGESNFLQSGTAPDGAVLIPVYHAVVPKEGLYRMSINYNKVPLSTIKKWNHLQSDEVSIGTDLIIGYLKVLKSESPLATSAGKTDFDNSSNANDEPKAPPVNPDANHDRLPPVKKPEPEKKENNEAVTEQTNVDKTAVTAPVATSTINFSGGFFKKMYNDQLEKKSPLTESGSAGTFKSTSGWKDGKYYCFNNEAQPGSVIKVTDNVTNKSVYAKVLDAIPDIKQNSGLSIILSNAAAEELGAGDAKFDCALSYVK